MQNLLTHLEDEIVRFEHIIEKQALTHQATSSLEQQQIEQQA